MHRPRTAVRLAVLVLLPGCLSATNGSSDPEAPGRPGDSADAGDPGDAHDAAATQDGNDARDAADPGEDACPPLPDASVEAAAPPPLPELPACDLACDRAVDCGVDACEGFEWSTSPRLLDHCTLRCDDDLARSMLEAGDCDAVLALVEESSPSFADACAEDPCAPVCDRLAHCVVEVCPAIGPQSEADMASGCRQDCNPDGAAWVLEARTCEDVIGPIADNDPGFRAGCYGEQVCPGRGPCRDYAVKVGRCVVDHCGGTAEPYADGLETLLFQYCTGAEDCPSEGDIEWVLSGDVDCATPPLDQLGQAPPFDRLCGAWDHLAAEDATAACERLFECSPDASDAERATCPVVLALRADAVAAADCMLDAPGCPERYACVAGP